MKRYALILTALVLSLTLVADGSFAQRGGRGGGGGWPCRRRRFRQPLPIDEPTQCSFCQSTFGTEHSTVNAKPSIGRATVNASVDSEPAFGWTTPFNTPFHAKPPFGRATVNTSRGRSWDTSLDSERGHPSQHRSRQDSERSRRPPRTAALDARLVQARRVAVAQHTSRATDCQSASSSTWKW